MKFNCRNQLPGETAEQYITTLYSLIESCDYNNLKEEMLQHWIVVSIQKRQKEAVREQHLQLQAKGSKEDPTVLDEVKGHKPPPKRGEAKPSQKQHRRHSTTTGKQQCKRCGWEHHTVDKCSARNVTISANSVSPRQ